VSTKPALDLCEGEFIASNPHHEILDGIGRRVRSQRPATAVKEHRNDDERCSLVAVDEGVIPD